MANINLQVALLAAAHVHAGEPGEDAVDRILRQALIFRRFLDSDGRSGMTEVHTYDPSGLDGTRGRE